MKNPNGYGTVYKLSGNRRRPFIAVITDGRRVDGRCNRHTLGYYSTREEGMAALSEYHQHPYNVTEKSASLIEMWTSYIKYRETREKPVVGSFKSAFNHLTALHDKSFVDIKPIHLQEVMDNLKDKPSVARNVRCVFSMLNRYARMRGLDAPKITDLVEMPVMAKSTLHKPFTAAEIDMLWGMYDQLSKIALLYIYTGLRPQELFLIRSENVHLKERFMVGGMKTEAGRNRQIPIAKKILPIVTEFYNRSGEYLMTSDKGKQLKYETIRVHWHNTDLPAVSSHKMHDGRHTCETLLDNAGTSKRTIQLILGHAGRDVDESVYTHKTLEQLIAAIDQI